MSHEDVLLVPILMMKNNTISIITYGHIFDP